MQQYLNKIINIFKKFINQIGSQRSVPIQGQHNIIPQQDDKQGQNLYGNRRKLYVQKYPKNLDSKLMTDILGGPIIEEIPKDPIIRRPRSSSRKTLNDQTNNMSLDMNQFSQMLDNDKMNKNSMSFHQPSLKDQNNMIDKNMIENEILELREKTIRQERNINGLNDIIKNLEGKMQHRQQIQDQDIQQILTGNKSQMQHYEQKIKDLEYKMNQDEKQNHDMRKNLQQNEQNQKEILQFIRNMQREETDQFNNMRGLLQDKLTEENNNNSKEKAKSKALFMEVVRLGENQEKQQNQVKQIEMELEDKIRFIVQKLNTGERAVSQLAEKGDKNLNQVGEWGEVTTQKIKEIENNISVLQRELSKEKQNVRNLEEMNSRIDQDLRQSMKSLKYDINQMNEDFFSQINSKIINEREERNKILDELQMSVDQKQRILTEKSAYDKQELKERINMLEQVLKSESTKNSEGLHQLQTQQDQNMKFIQDQIKTSENNRIVQENQLKQDILKIQEQFHKDYDSFKNYQIGITEKITEMMKHEIQTRLDSDIDLKNLTSSIAQDIVQDVNRVKDSIELQFKEVYDELKNMNSECASRCSKLSVFTEQECSILSTEFIKKFDKMKEMFTKLAEQFKSHLIHYDTNRTVILQKVDTVDAKCNNIGMEIMGSLQDQQKLFQSQISSDIKLSDEEINGVKIQLQDRCIKIEQEQLKDIELIKEALSDLTQTLNEKIDNTQRQNDAILQTNDDKLQEVLLNTKGIREQIQIFDDRLNQIQDSQMNGSHSSNNQFQSDLNLMIQNQNSINTQFQVDLDQLTENIITSDQNRQLQIQELVDYCNSQEGEIAANFQQIEESVLNNLKLVNETIQTIESLQSTLDENIINLEADITLEKTMNKTEIINIKQDLNNLIQTIEKQNTINKNINSGQNLENNSQIIQEQQINNLKKEIQEQHERKLQIVLENIKRENQKIWKESLEQIKSNYSQLIDKDNQKTNIRDNQPLNRSEITFQTRLNEILLTQDTYNKPQLKQKK